MSNVDDHRLFTEDPLADLALLVTQARQISASRLLLLAGRHPVCRIADKLSPPLTEERLHFSQTEALVRCLLSQEQEAELDKSGSIETIVEVASQSYPCSVFFGNGSHNFILFLLQEDELD